MSGVIFKITIPTQEHEYAISRQSKRKSTANSQSSLLEACAVDDQVFTVKCERKPSPKMKAVKLNCGPCEYLNKRVQMDEPIPMRKSMKQTMEDIFNEIKINNATWTPTNNNNFYQVTFPIESRARCEKVLNALKGHKIGKKLESIVSVIPCSIYYCEDEEEEEEEEDKYDHGTDTTEKVHMSHKSAWNRFVSSVRARLVVAQVAENIETNAALTFDFACLLVIASLLCAIGLVENSSMFLLSSMLISPMMRPVMAGTFGTVIGDSKLQIMGVQNGIIGLSIATLIGFCYGAIICAATDKYGDSSWPTYEMTSRGEIRSLWVGCLVALLSGAAVALGILSDFIASLVGAAISTSLMPPAVNAGLLWSLTTIYYLKGDETTRYSSLHVTSFYSKNKTIELATQGAVSMCLTFINIVCIYLAGILIFKIKEVAPITSTDQAKKEFWNNNIKVARDYNKTLQNDEARSIKMQFQHSDITPDVTAGHIPDCQETESLLQHHSLDLLDKVASKVNRWECQYTWSPCSYCPVSKLKRAIETSGVCTNLKNLRYNTIKQENRKLSSLFSPNNMCTGSNGISTENFPHRSVNLSNSATEIAASSRKMRFVVTPCALDNASE